ncbi:MAG: GTP-binding protein [Candidatus Heimdallarchaeota archaeon]|nr:GTP-binding protein [Candidatus Heimdallarchaeota archaeon]
MRDEWVLKICAAGSFQVGKTSLIRRYAENKFSESYTPTIGVDVTVKKIVVDNQPVKLLLWDTAGQEVFGRIRRTYFEGAFGCIVVYDITREETFKELNRWISDFRNVAGDNSSIAVLGNKADLETLRKVTKVDGENFAKKFNVPFKECSAKIGGDEITEIYTHLVKKYLDSLS